jgi:glucose-1-phosphate thymidylyltransferase
MIDPMLFFFLKKEKDKLLIYMIKKALLLSSGKATRFYPVIKNYPKQLLPVLNKPVLFYCIEKIINAGIKSIGIIVRDRKGAVVKKVRKAKYNAKITFIEQRNPLGLAHGVKVARDYLKDDYFLMYLGDTLIEEDLNKFINKFEKNKPNAIILLGKTDNPKICGIAEIKNNRIIRLVEKPKKLKSNLALAGLYIFDKNIFNAIKNIKPSKRGELEITDAIQYLINNSYEVTPYITKKRWIDVGSPESFVLANILLMEGDKNYV